MSPYLLPIEALSFTLGLVFGSFLNVCIARVPNGESIVSPRSRCPECGKPIRWYDNIPLLSWILLRARCRHCRRPVSWQYPAVELATGLWFLNQSTYVWAAIHQQLQSQIAFITLTAVSTCILGFLLIGLIVMDWKTGLLPDAFTLSGIAIAFFLVCIQAIFLDPGQGQIVMNATKQLRLRSPGSFAAQGNVFLTGTESLIFGRIAAVCAVALLLLSIRWAYKAVRKRDGMGLGDVKMLAMIAAFLGFSPTIVALFVAVFTACAYSLTMLVRGRAAATTRIAFGGFLGVGGLASALYGERVVDWYFRLLQ